jgi:hypothetical protein
MSGSGSKAPPPPGGCPFCGVPSLVPHESQEGCIAALHAEIGRMRGILATLRPAAGSLVPHESQEGCIAALHAEIGRMRGILATLKPAGVAKYVTDADHPPAAVRLSLSKNEFR